MEILLEPTSNKLLVEDEEEEPEEKKFQGRRRTPRRNDKEVGIGVKDENCYEMAHALVEKKGKAKDEYYGKLILDLGNEVRFSVEQGTAAMERLVEKLGNAKDKVECKNLKKELEEARFSNTFLRMQNEQVERDLYWTRVRAHKFYQDMIRRGFLFEERSNETIEVLVKDKERATKESRGKSS
ncbi:hypothetical protein Tco_0762177 [Tanacetum coccineum]